MNKYTSARRVKLPVELFKKIPPNGHAEDYYFVLTNARQTSLTYIFKGAVTTDSTTSLGYYALKKEVDAYVVTKQLQGCAVTESPNWKTLH